MPTRLHTSWLLTVLTSLFAMSLPGAIRAADLPADLVARIAATAELTKRSGDAARGAELFFNAELACAACHDERPGSGRIGPDLATLDRDAAAATVVESILAPSATIRDGFHQATLLAVDGRVATGVLVSDEDDVVLRRTADGRELRFRRPEVEELVRSEISPMPSDFGDRLSNRQLADLTAYVLTIMRDGNESARQLAPAWLLASLPQIPAYEFDLDHAGLISAWDDESLSRGGAIYRRVCANCHGTHDREGSLPTAPRFAEHVFKNGADPLSLYATITHGYGRMRPQAWMVPRQKYDVVHYLRETYLRDSDKNQYTSVTPAYLASLPRGDELGPEPSNIDPWSSMDYGPLLAHTYEFGEDAANFAYKGEAVRLDAGPGGVARGRAWMIFDHDTMRAAGGWTGEGFIDYRGIMFNGEHGIHPRVVGDVHFENATGPGWANPATGEFDDVRLRGRDGRPYGPLPNAWARYHGYYRFGDRIVFSYAIGDAEILESPAIHSLGNGPENVAFVRYLQIERSSRDLLLRAADAGASVQISGCEAASVDERDGAVVVRIPAAATPCRLSVYTAKAGAHGDLAAGAEETPDLNEFTHGGPAQYPEALTVAKQLGRGAGPFVVDVLTDPTANPWQARIRCTGLDFYDDGDRLAVCTWDGDVWEVSGLADDAAPLVWRRIAAGLFQPLGLKLIDGKIFLTCRDQICVLEDLNGDGETDFYRCFNNDQQVTDHFHEFAMGLQRGDDGSLYYAKSARHALKALVPHHGTLLRVAPDGSRTDIVAFGFRAANGVCLNPDGTFIVTDQEGHWNPKNRINWVREGGFYGNMWGYHDVVDESDSAMEQPLCWITNAFDRSPAELLWVPEGMWGPLAGSLLNMSYGNGRIFVVPHEEIDGQMQGGMVALPLPQAPTGLIRGRFHPTQRQLYACGMFAWAGDQQQPGGLYRIRYVGGPADLPKSVHARRGRLELTLSDDVGGPRELDPADFSFETWSLKRSQRYGSDHYDERQLEIQSAAVSEDGRTVVLEIDELAPTWCYALEYRFSANDGRDVAGEMHGTIHRLGE